MAPFLYFALAGLFYSQPHIWFSALVVPVFLLRSDESTSLSLQKFEAYVDRLSQPADAEAVLRTWQFWTIVVLAVTIAALASYAIATLVPASLPFLLQAVLYTLIAYGAATTGLAFVIATEPGLVAAVAPRRLISTLLGLSLTMAVAVGGFLAAAPWIGTACAVLGSLLLALMVAFEVPRATAEATMRTASEVFGDTRGMAFIRVVQERAPITLTLFVPAFFFGGFLRSAWIRAVSNATFLRSGWRALPQNYLRHLFVVDLRHTPELIADYQRSDPANFRYIFERLKRSRHRYIYSVGILFLFVPGYSYRLYIKATCWLYAPIFYISRPLKLANNPAYLVDVLNGTPKEWISRCLAFFTIGSVLISNVFAAGRLGARLPKGIDFPLEYILVLDLSKIAPWQWFNLASAVITIILFFAAYGLAAMLRHEQSDVALVQAAGTRARSLEIVMRVRDLSTYAYLAIAVLHLVLVITPLKEHLHPYVLLLLRQLYGAAMP